MLSRWPVDDENVQAEALNEFDEFVRLLRENGVQVLVINDSAEPYTPDSIFPNNWISFHEDGTIVLYSYVRCQTGGRNANLKYSNKFGNNLISGR